MITVSLKPNVLLLNGNKSFHYICSSCFSRSLLNPFFVVAKRRSDAYINMPFIIMVVGHAAPQEDDENTSRTTNVYIILESSSDSSLLADESLL